MLILNLQRRFCNCHF